VTSRGVFGSPVLVTYWTDMAFDEMRGLVDEFNAAWNSHNLAAALRLCAPDVVVETTGPPPDGARLQGHDSVRDAWAPVFDDPRSHFDFEEPVLCLDKARRGLITQRLST
jgi:ketosteroid isomerase-like protein